jgi:hypothetical protein
VAGGGPVLPLCGLIFLLAAVGPFQESRRASADYAFAQTKPGMFQDWAVELDRQLVPVGRTFSVLWCGIGGALLATPLFLTSRVWQVRRRLNRFGRNYAIGGLLLSAVGALVWLLGALANAVGSIGGGRDSSHSLSAVGYLGIIAGAIVALGGSIVAAIVKPEAGNVTA